MHSPEELELLPGVGMCNKLSDSTADALLYMQTQLIDVRVQTDVTLKSIYLELYPDAGQTSPASHPAYCVQHTTHIYSGNYVYRYSNIYVRCIQKALAAKYH